MSRARLARRLRGGWDPSLHPRWPKGAPSSQGGEFSRGMSVEVMDPIPAKVEWPVPHIGDMLQTPLGELLDRDHDFHPAFFPDPASGDVLDVQKIAQEAETIFVQPWTQDEIRDNLTEARHNVARWMRAVERVVGDVLGKPHSAWQGDIKLDVAGLGMADGVKTWDCEFLFLSSIIHGWQIEKKKPWGLMVHEMMHAYSQQAGFDNGLPIGGQKLHFQDGHRMIEEGIADGAAYWNFREIQYQLGIGSEDYERVRNYSSATRDFEALASAVGIQPREFFNQLITTPITERKAELHDMISEATRKPVDRWFPRPAWLRASKKQLHPEDAMNLHKWVDEEKWETSFSSWTRLFAGNLPWQVDNKILDEAKNYPTMEWRKMGEFWYADGGWWIQKDSLYGGYEVVLTNNNVDIPIVSAKTLAGAKAAARIRKGGGEVPEANILRTSALDLMESTSSDDIITRMLAAATPAEITIVEQDARLWLQTHEPTDEFYAAARLMARTKGAFEPPLQEFDIHQPRWPKGNPHGGEWKAMSTAVFSDVLDDVGSLPDDAGIADLQWGAYDSPNPTELWKIITDRERDVNEQDRPTRMLDFAGRLKDANAREIGARLVQDPRIDNAYEDWRGRMDELLAGPLSPTGRLAVMGNVPLLGERADGPKSEMLPFNRRELGPDEQLDWYRNASKQDYAEMVVHAMHMQWARTSNDHDAMAWAVQLAAEREFEDLMGRDPFWMTGNSRQTAEDILDDDPFFGEVLGALVRAQHDEFQKLFADRGIDEIKLYRGVKDDAFTEDDQGSEVEVPLAPLSSWSLDVTIAGGFADSDYGRGYVLRATVPIEHIHSSTYMGFGAHNEEEFVVFGGERNAAVHYVTEDPFDEEEEQEEYEQRGFDDERTFRKWLSGYPEGMAPWFAGSAEMKWMDAGFDTAAEYDMQRALFSQRSDWEWQTLGFKSKKHYDIFVQQYTPL